MEKNTGLPRRHKRTRQVGRGRVFLSRCEAARSPLGLPLPWLQGGILVDQLESRFFYLPNRESRDEEKEKAKAQT